MVAPLPFDTVAIYVRLTDYNVKIILLAGRERHLHCSDFVQISPGLHGYQLPKAIRMFELRSPTTIQMRRSSKVILAGKGLLTSCGVPYIQSQ